MIGYFVIKLQKVTKLWYSLSINKSRVAATYDIP